MLMVIIVFIIDLLQKNEKKKREAIDLIPLSFENENKFILASFRHRQTDGERSCGGFTIHIDKMVEFLGRLMLALIKQAVLQKKEAHTEEGVTTSIMGTHRSKSVLY